MCSKRTKKLFLTVKKAVLQDNQDRRRNNAADAANRTKENLAERITKFSNLKATKMCTEFR